MSERGRELRQSGTSETTQAGKHPARESWQKESRAIQESGAQSGTHANRPSARGKEPGEGAREQASERESARESYDRAATVKERIQEAFLGGKACRQKAAQCRSQVCNQAYTQAKGADRQACKPPIPTGWSSSSAVLQRLATAMLYLRWTRERSLWLFHVKNSCNK